ncbi:TPA: hypothetical protein DIV45_00700 [Patescibacteria group bacterium]|nr:hypothetical protein [Patescibacteria group bacterium]
MNKYTPLSENTQAIILGSVLGDGSLKLYPGYANARFSFRHSEKQSDYFWWKANQLQEISGKKFAWRQSKNGKDGWGTVKYRFCSQALPALTEMFKLTHSKNKFLIRRKWLNLLTPLSLAILWQDDGSIIANGRKGVVCTDGFTKPEVQLLQQYLKVVWRIHTVVGLKNKQSNQFRLWFRSTEQLQSFLRIILPHIAVAQMIPKFILLYHDHQLQQRWISEVATISGFPLKTVVEYYDLKKSKWKNYRESDAENDIVQSV